MKLPTDVELVFVGPEEEARPQPTLMSFNLTRGRELILGRIISTKIVVLGRLVRGGFWNEYRVDVGLAGFGGIMQSLTK